MCTFSFGLYHRSQRAARAVIIPSALSLSTSSSLHLHHLDETTLTFRITYPQAYGLDHTVDES